MLRPSAFVIEIDGATAGLAVVVEREFQFFAAATRAWPVDGRRFRSFAALRRAVRSTLAHRSNRGRPVTSADRGSRLRSGCPEPDRGTMPRDPNSPG